MTTLGNRASSKNFVYDLISIAIPALVDLSHSLSPLLLRCSARVALCSAAACCRSFVLSVALQVAWLVQHLACGASKLTLSGCYFIARCKGLMAVGQRAQSWEATTETPCRTQPAQNQRNPVSAANPYSLADKAGSPLTASCHGAGFSSHSVPCPVPPAASLPAMWFIARTKWRRQEASSPSLTATLASFISWNQRNWMTWQANCRHSTVARAGCLTVAGAGRLRQQRNVTSEGVCTAFSLLGFLANLPE